MLAAAYCLMPLLTDRTQCYNQRNKIIWSALLTIKLVTELLLTETEVSVPCSQNPSTESYS